MTHFPRIEKLSWDTVSQISRPSDGAGPVTIITSGNRVFTMPAASAERLQVGDALSVTTVFQVSDKPGDPRDRRRGAMGLRHE
jgi:hypothetical protein